MEVRRFDKEELAFFAVPRPWKQIELRFDCRTQKDENPFRDAFIEADDDGGMGFLRWLKDRRSWVLTDKGKSWVGPELLAKGRAWSPPKKRRDPKKDPPVDIFGDDPVAEAAEEFVARNAELLSRLEDDSYEVIPCEACGTTEGCRCREESPEAETARLVREQEEDESE